jgi:hypothetical protein
MLNPICHLLALLGHHARVLIFTDLFPSLLKHFKPLEN